MAGFTVLSPRVWKWPRNESGHVPPTSSEAQERKRPHCSTSVQGGISVRARTDVHCLQLHETLRLEGKHTAGCVQCHSQHRQTYCRLCAVPQAADTDLLQAVFSATGSRHRPTAGCVQCHRQQTQTYCRLCAVPPAAQTDTQHWQLLSLNQPSCRPVSPAAVSNVCLTTV
jgi:ribulose bisphosphate carboxylase small subunit